MVKNIANSNKFGNKLKVLSVNHEKFVIKTTEMIQRTYFLTFSFSNFKYLDENKLKPKIMEERLIDMAIFEYGIRGSSESKFNIEKKTSKIIPNKTPI
jgi:hypothetical protein